MNPFIRKSDADKQMGINLANVGGLGTAIVTRLMLLIGNKLGAKIDDYEAYLRARELAIIKGFVHKDMDFTPYNYISN